HDAHAGRRAAGRPAGGRAECAPRRPRGHRGAGPRQALACGRPGSGRGGGRMKHARVVYEGSIRAATGTDAGLRLDDGREVSEEQVTWLPPTEFGTIFALGLSCADHVKELDFQKAPEEPLLFLKGPCTLTGHRSLTRR